jgi:hypothetical protein
MQDKSNAEKVLPDFLVLPIGEGILPGKRIVPEGVGQGQRYDVKSAIRLGSVTDDAEKRNCRQ